MPRRAQLSSDYWIGGNKASASFAWTCPGSAGAGMLEAARRLWDALGLGARIDVRTREVPGRYRPSLTDGWS